MPAPSLLSTVRRRGVWICPVVAVVVLIAGCATEQRGSPPQPSPPLTSTAALASQIDAASSTPTSEPSETDASPTHRLELVDPIPLSVGTDDLDALTGAYLDNRSLEVRAFDGEALGAPLDLGPGLVRGPMSPNGRHVALMRQDEQGEVEELAVLDLAEGGAPLVVLDGVSWTIGEVLWRPDGEGLLVFEDLCAEMLSEGRCAEPWRHVLRDLPLDGRGPSILGEYDLWASEARLSADGTTVVALAAHSEQCCGLAAESAPALVAIDAATGRLLGEVPLTGLLAGQRSEQRPHGDFWVYYRPSVAVAPDASRAYVAHADSDRVTVVDLTSFEVDQVAAPSRRTGNVERFTTWLLGRFVSRAEAKGGLYYDRQALLSPDGSRLFVAGTHDETCEEQESYPCRSGVPAGLRVIDTTDMSLLFEEPRVGRVVLSQDGRTLAGTGSRIGVFVLDTATLDHRLLREGVGYDEIAVAPDGQHVYAVAAVPFGRDDPYGCGTECSLLTVFDTDRDEAIRDHLSRPLFRPLIGR